MPTKAIQTITRNTLKELAIMLPVFFIAIIIGITIEMYLPKHLLETLTQKHIFIAIPLATLLGILLPIPRYATYPIAFALLVAGVGYGIIFALICGEVIGESIVRDIMEIKYLGGKFFALRFVLSFIFITLGGFTIEILL